MKKYTLKARIPTTGPGGKKVPAGYVIAEISFPDAEAAKFFADRLRWSHWQFTEKETATSKGKAE